MGNEALREMLKKNIRWALTDGENGLYQSVCKKYKEKNLSEPSYTEYVFNIFDTFFNLFQYTLPSKHQEKLENMTKDELKALGANISILLLAVLLVKLIRY